MKVAFLLVVAAERFALLNKISDKRQEDGRRRSFQWRTQSFWLIKRKRPSSGGKTPHQTPFADWANWQQKQEDGLSLHYSNSWQPWLGKAAFIVLMGKRAAKIIWLICFVFLFWMDSQIQSAEMCNFPHMRLKVDCVVFCRSLCGSLAHYICNYKQQQQEKGSIFIVRIPILQRAIQMKAKHIWNNTCTWLNDNQSGSRSSYVSDLLTAMTIEIGIVLLLL